MSELAAALSALQSELPRIARADLAQIETKSGGKYTYTYANLAAITEAIMPLLGKHGLSFICRPNVTGEGRFSLSYSLLHKSGEREDGDYPLPTGGSPQSIGSAITYGRRYCLCAVTGVAPEEDDDGATAEASSQAAAEPPMKGQPAATRKMSRRKQTGAEQEPEPITPAQLTKLHTCYGDFGITEREDKLNYAAKVLGQPVDSSRDLTKTEAMRIIDALDADILAAIPALQGDEDV
jgi:hypothetical protein